MRRPFLYAVLVLLVLAFFAYHIFPMGDRLRLGKDLAGGTSLVYQVQIETGQNAESILNRTIEVLKDRLDPQGVKDLAIVPQGRDRLEISFPLPNETVTELRRDYEEKLAALRDQVIRPGEVERVLRLSEPERSAGIDRLAAGIPERERLLEEAAEHLAEAERLDAELEQTRAELLAATESLSEARADPDVDPETLAELEARVDTLQAEFDALVPEVSAAERAYEDARDGVLDTVLNPEDLRAALERSDERIVKFDSATGERVEIPSPRQQALESILESHPSLADEIQAVIDAHDAYSAEATGFDDPADVIRLLRGSGVLDFRISVDPGAHPEEERLRRELQERGPRSVRANDARWYKIRRIESWYDTVQQLRALTTDAASYFAGRGYVVEPYEGEFYMLCYDSIGNRLTAAEGQWSVASASQGVDDLGRPAINYLMDTPGARLLGRLTEPHVGDQLAILLDDQVVTAPNIGERISRSIRISGDFDQSEIDYVIRVLSAGSLAARLSPEPLSTNTLGPDLGQDNLESGLNAGFWAFGIVAVFMVIYYYVFGGVAVFALGCNAILVLGAMSLSEQAFTLPGIAGVVLTFGIAVDANVLIYERIREEVRKGADIKAAVRLGYQRALSAIVDGNVTNLIVTVVLYNFGTTEIKGFALTLGIGVVTTLFSALVITRIIYTILIEHVGWRKVAMLPLSFPVIDRLLEPNIGWLRARWAFVFISSIYVGLGLFMIFYQGSEMLDIEFREGTQVTINLSQDDQPVERTRQDIKEKIDAIADRAEQGSQLTLLRTADIIPVNARADGVTSDTFTIKTLATDKEAVVEAIVTELAEADLIQTLPPLSFEGEKVEQIRLAPVYPITQSQLGDVIPKFDSRRDVSAFSGGAAILLDNIQPPDSVEDIRRRIDLLRDQPDYSQTLSREIAIDVLEGTPDAATAVVILVRDPAFSFFDDPASWSEEVAAFEWSLVREALGRAQSPAQVLSFSPAIAETFRTQAVISVLMSFLLILIYIWVRFGSVRYSVAAIIPLLHDVLTVLGLIALAEILFKFPGTESLARALGLLPFKIDLALVAAMLTIVGYSLNDTIILMDRIRENRGKLDYASRKVINTSVNQIISRTVITSGTTLLAVLILYMFGGEGVRGFAFAMLMGVAVGTYSSIAVAAPIVWSEKRDRSKPDDDLPPPAAAAEETAVATT